MKEEKLCSVCSAVFPEEQLVGFAGEWLCPDCLERETRICYHCGNRIWNDDNAGSSSVPLCQSCYDEYYTCLFVKKSFCSEGIFLLRLIMRI